MYKVEIKNELAVGDIQFIIKKFVTVPAGKVKFEFAKAVSKNLKLVWAGLSHTNNPNLLLKVYKDDAIIDADGFNLGGNYDNVIIPLRYIAKHEFRFTLDNLDVNNPQSATITLIFAREWWTEEEIKGIPPAPLVPAT